MPRQRLGTRLQAPAWVTCPPLNWAPRLGTDRRWWASSSPFQGVESTSPQSPLMLSGQGEKVQMLERQPTHLNYRSGEKLRRGGISPRAFGYLVVGRRLEARLKPLHSEICPDTHFSSSFTGADCVSSFWSGAGQYQQSKILGAREGSLCVSWRPKIPRNYLLLVWLIQSSEFIHGAGNTAGLGHLETCLLIKHLSVTSSRNLFKPVGEGKKKGGALF